uniref:Uncharacterized protein n=1 Tax=Anguilla anguilla TaxID=7936 RepID=A0A0E9XWE8_ANGAN
MLGRLSISMTLNNSF